MNKILKALNNKKNMKEVTRLSSIDQLSMCYRAKGMELKKAVKKLHFYTISIFGRFDTELAVSREDVIKLINEILK